MYLFDNLLLYVIQQLDFLSNISNGGGMREKILMTTPFDYHLCCEASICLTKMSLPKGIKITVILLGCSY